MNMKPTKNRFYKLFTILTLTVLCGGNTFAQVRQAVKVLDYGTGKPLQGVQIKCEKQASATNAKGVAVFKFTGKTYGDYVDFDWNFKLPGYISLGSGWKEHLVEPDILRKDTLYVYMVNADRYYAERDRLFDSLAMHLYRHDLLPDIDSALKTMKEYPNTATDGAEFIISPNYFQT